MPRRQSPRLYLERLEDRVTPSVTVTTTLDPATPIAGQLSLREAINMVNAGQVADNTILLPTGTYQNAQGALNVTHSLILQGAGAGNTILDGGGTDRVVFIDPAAAINVQISGVTVRDGNTTGEGGGIDVQDVSGQSSVLTVTNCVITANTAGNGQDGGGIDANNGDININNSQITNNQVPGMEGFGGGIADNNFGMGNVTVTDSLIADNTAGGAGGGIGELDGGPGALTVGNNVPGFGGGLRDSVATSTVTLVSCLFANNSAITSGGGIDQVQGTLIIRASQFTGNVAAVEGGALHFDAAPPLVVSDSTFNDNRAGTFGGAILFVGVMGTSSLTNDTFTNNTALGDGGALALEANTLALVNDTINGNTAEKNGGGVSVEAAGTYSFQNTLVAGNTAGGNGPDVFTATGLSVLDKGGNFLGNLGGSAGFGPGTPTGNPQLGPLADNGGPLAGATGDQQVVQTEALLPGSPAIDKGVAMGAPTTDERGFTRPIGAGPDIGAFEFQNVALTVTVTPATPTVPVNNTETFTVTVTNTSGNALPADNSTLAVTLSAGLTSSDPLTFTLGTLAAGQSQTFTVTATATTLGTQKLSAVVSSVDANPNTVSGSAAVTVVASLPAAATHAPIGALTLFAFGFGPTGIDLFEVDSAGDVFALPFMGGAPLFLNTTLHLPLAVLQDGQLLALLAGANGQNFLIDVFNPFLPSVEPAVLAALLHG